MFFVDPTGKSPDTPEGWSADNVRLANRFGVFGNGGDSFDSFFDVKSYDLGEKGLVTVNEYGHRNKRRMLWPGKEDGAHYVADSYLPITLRYYPGSNSSNPINFVQTVGTNLPRAAMLKGDLSNVNFKEIVYTVDGYNVEGTYYTPNEIKNNQQGEDVLGSYYEFSDTPHRPFVRGKTIRWDAELSVVEKTSGQNVRLISFTWGFKLKRSGRPKVKRLRRVGSVSSFHQQSIGDATIE